MCPSPGTKLILICLLAGFDFGRCILSIMSSQESDAVIADECELQVVPLEAAPKGKNGSRARSRNASNAAEACFLCGKDLDPVNDTVVVWRGH